MPRRIEDIEAHKSSGNVFLDIGFPPHEAAMLLAKAHLIVALESVLKRRKLSQRQAAKLLKTDQSMISKLFSGRSQSASIDQLIKWLSLLGQSVEVGVRPTAGASSV